MNTDLYWTVRIERIETLRQEAAQHRLACQAVRVNLWARLLPLLRRLEAWMERHAKPEASTYKASAR
jgi:hypothetical protein